MADPNVERTARLDTATISDALDQLGIAGQCLGIKPRDPSFRLAGRAYTVRYGPVDPVRPGTVGDYVDALEPGTVVVVAIPRMREEEVLGIAEEIGRAEKAIRDLLDGGSTLAEAREKLGYHKLQRRRS